jgi:peptidyl-prolyl cis-trans isomerase D
MLAGFRAFAKSPFAVLLLGMLIVAFAVWGVGDAFKLNLATWVIKAGSHEVSAEDYKNAFDGVVRQQEQKVGRPITTEEAIAAGADRQILSGMADENAVAELIKRLGVRPDDRLVLAELAKNPSFADPLTGKFSDAAYRNLLAQNHVRPETYWASLQDQIAQRQLASGLGVGTKAPRIYAAMMSSFILENRAADYILLDQHAVPAPAQPTDKQLLTFMQENSAMLKQPEFRTLSLVRFSSAAIAPTLTVDPAEVQKRFDLEKAALAVPERRAFLQINFKDASQASAASARLAKGEPAAAVAKAYGAEITPYPATSLRAIPDLEVAKAVFALQPGKSSAPVKTGFGYAVVTLIGVNPAKEPTLEEARAKIEGELRADAALKKVYEQVQKYNDAHDSGAPMAKAAAAAGVKVYTVGPITADGVDKATHQKDPSLTQKMLGEAFSLPTGGESDEVQDLGKGENYAIRVEAIAPAALPKLDEVRAPLTMRYMMMDVAKRLQARATELSARLTKGEAIDKVAASAGLPVRHVDGLSRATAAQHKDLGEDFIGKVFAAKPGEAFIARTSIGVTVGKVSAITSGPVGEVARVAQQGSSQVSEMLTNDVGETLRDIARERIKPKVNPAKARQALGLSPETGAASSAAPAKGK